MEQENHPDLSNTISRTYFRCEGFEYGFILSDHGLVHRGRTGVIRVCHVAFRSEGQRKNVRHPENLVFAVCSGRYGILDI